MKIIIVQHDGKTFETEMKDYDAVKVAELINDDTKPMVTLGSVVMHRTKIANVYPVKDLKEGKDGNA